MGSELLRPYRVLDLTSEYGELAGRILADLGADVIKIEPPEGDPSRWRPPFFADRPDRESSLPWWASNLNKRSIVLDLEDPREQSTFRRLVGTADFVLESFQPGYLDQLGLGFAALAEINPRIIVTSITPFGQTGPYTRFPATDLTLQALGGFLYVNGDADRPPVRISATAVARALPGHSLPTSSARRNTNRSPRPSSAFLLTRTLDELYQKAVELRFRLAPAATAKDILESRQIRARGLLASVPHPELDASFLYPGAFARFSVTPIETFRRPPLLGEHTQEVVRELESVGNLARSTWPPAPPTRHIARGHRGVFDGLRIVDFTWAAAGPIATRHLGDYGATVVKIESTKHPDSLRVGPPFVDGEPGNRSGFFAQFNPNKVSVTIDMTNSTGRRLARRLILEWADVVVDCFTPRVMPGWGLAYADLRTTRPDLIMLSTCMQGQTGPYRDYAGFGDQSAALSGFFMLNGWPDHDPATPNGAYTDMATPHFRAAALLAALDYRARTGQGQHIDVSQIECGVHFLAPEVLDYTVRGHVPQRMANRSLRAAPHGVFPVQGNDCWIAIACETDAHWAALVHAMGSPAWTTGAAYATLQARLAHQDTLEGRLAEWTARHDGRVLQERLLHAGVPAGVAVKALDLFDDPQLVHRNHFVPPGSRRNGSVELRRARLQIA